MRDGEHPYARLDRHIVEQAAYYDVTPQQWSAVIDACCEAMESVPSEDFLERQESPVKDWACFT